MDLGLDGRVAIVGGASRGLGQAIATALAHEGVALTIFARTPGPLKEAGARIADSSGVKVHTVAADAANPNDLRRVMDETVAQFGRVDILVNNAGGPPPGAFESLDDEAWQAAFDLSFMSAVRLTRLAVPHMRYQQWGRVLNLVSFTVRQPRDRLVLSNAIRLSVVGLAKTLAKELAPNILVNNVAPGLILTERTRQLNFVTAAQSGERIEEIEGRATATIPLGRYGKPEEFAAMVTFLASERASYITGQTFLCDGGLVTSI
ncbi:MAG: short-chain dehydrogenase/reductase [Chloroflexi bacterium]|nr:short-chain dehydrogenase/reductase [Chloroflexota bacterium]